MKRIPGSTTMPILAELEFPICVQTMLGLRGESRFGHFLLASVFQVTLKILKLHSPEVDHTLPCEAGSQEANQAAGIAAADIEQVPPKLPAAGGLHPVSPGQPDKGLEVPKDVLPSLARHG
jgi:hypothetical protein